MKTVSIIILNFNGAKNTTACLTSICDGIYQDLKLSIVVVDNSSKEEDKQILRENIKEKESHDIPIVFIENKYNVGYSGGNNTGISYALKNNTDYCLILNNDTIVDKHFVEELENAFSDNSVGIAVSKIYFAKGFEFHKDRYKKEDLGKILWYAGGRMDWQNVIGYHRGVDEVDTGQYDRIEDTEIATGCCMLVRREVMENIGLFDEKYFLYYEDADFSMRAKRAGFKIRYVPKAMLWHKNAGSAGGSGSALQDYYISRNRMLFGMRYASLRSKFSLLRESLKLLARGRKWQKRGIIDFYFQKSGKGSYPVNREFV